MRCFAKARSVSWCVFIASVLGAPIALVAADQPKASSDHRPAATRSSDLPGAVPSAVRSYGDLPLSFEANRGQAEHNVRFLSRGNGYTFFLTPGEAVLAFSKDKDKDKERTDSSNRAAVLHMRLEGSNANAQVSGVDALPGTSNYFFGQDPSQWRTGVPTYRKVAYTNIYPGINLVYYGNQRQLEYDFVVSPGVDPRVIRLSVGGASKVTVDAQGDLVLHSREGDVRLLAPKAYQDVDGRRHQIAGQWQLAADKTAVFGLAFYDRSKTLVIDPVLLYSSFLGGSQNTSITRIATDAAGNAYVAGYTASGDFPASPTPESTTFGGGSNSRGAFVAKIDPTGSSLIYTTYLSGSVDEQASGIAVDASGDVYVTGKTHSLDFPVLGAFQSACAVSANGSCSDAFLTKIASTGNALVYSTYLGGAGDDAAMSVAVDASGNAYVSGVTTSKDFPATAGSAQVKCGGSCNQNGFIAKFNSFGTSLAYATYLGGSGSDGIADMAVDALGNVYVTGQTSSADFPTASAFQKTCTLESSGSTGACVATSFVAKLNADGSALTYSTYLGGSLGSKVSGIAVDSQGSAYVTGSTHSADFPVLNAFQKSCGKNASNQCVVNAFVAKLTAAGSALVYSTYLGGSTQDEASGIAVDAAGNAHIVGSTASTDFPTARPVQSKLNGTSDAFVAELNSTGKALGFSTFHGGSSTETGNSLALDASGNIYVSGATSSADFPTLTPFQSSCAGTCSNAFVSKLSAVAQAGTPASITATAGTPQTANVSTTFATALQATVLDSSSNPVSGVAVTFTAPGSGASGLFANSTTTTQIPTDTNGVATATAYTANSTAGAYLVTATVTTFTANFSLTNAGPPAAIAVVPPTDNQSATISTAFTTNLQATVTDLGGNLVPGATVVFTAPGSGASGTFANGTATTTVTTGTSGATLGIATATVFTANTTAGPYSVAAKVGAFSTNFSLTNNSGAPASIAVVPSTNNQSAAINAAFATNLQATVKDIGGNLVPSASVVFTAPASGASGLFANSTITTTVTTGTAGATLGIATATVFTANNTAGGPYTVTAVVGAFTANFSLTNNAGSPSAVTATAGTPQTAAAGVAFAVTLQATVKDNGNNLVPNATVTFTAPGSGASGTFANGTATTTATTGAAGATRGIATSSVFTANCTLGNFNVTASSGAATPATYALTITVGAPKTVQASAGTTPQSTPVTDAFPTLLGATVVDCGNNPTAGIKVSFTASTGSGGSSGTFNDTSNNITTAITDASGVATTIAPITANHFSGTFTVSGTAAGATTNASFALTNTPGPPAAVAPVGGSTPQSAQVGTPFVPLGALVTDANGNPVAAGAPVVFTATATGLGATGTFSNGTATITINTAAGGVASAPFTANTKADTTSYSVSATTNGVSTSYVLTNIPGPPAAIINAGGTSQNVAVTDIYGTLLSGTVTDQYGNTVLAGVAVKLTAPGAGASGKFANGTATTTVNTLATGAFAGTAFTANSTAGAYSVSAVSGAASAQYALVNTDFALTSTSPSIYIQGTNVPIATSAPPMITVTPLPAPPALSYTGTVTLSCVGASLPAGVTCPSFTPPTAVFANGSPASVLSAATVSVSATTPVGLYEANPVMVLGADASPNPVANTTSFGLAVECTYSLGNSGSAGTLPVYSPLESGTPFTFFVTENAGGSICPWDSLTATAGIIGVSATSGTVTAPGTGNPVTFGVTPISSSAIVAQTDTVSVSYFQVNGATIIGTSSLNVTQEPFVTLTGGVGTTTVNLTATNPGTLAFSSATGLAAGVTTICGAQNDDGPDTSGNNYFITCSAQVTGSTAQVGVTVGAATPASRRPVNHPQLGLLYSAGLGFPAIVFMGLGAAAFGPKRKRAVLRRIASLLGVLLLLSLLVVLPACSGGFSANFVNPSQVGSYTITVMGYVTDVNNNVTAVEIFTVPMNVVK